jgi:hypothetical protein
MKVALREPTSAEHEFDEANKKRGATVVYGCRGSLVWFRFFRERK